MKTLIKIVILLIIHFQLSIFNCPAQSPVNNVGSGCMLEFNGSNNYVEKLLPYSLPLYNSPRTIEAWVKPYFYGQIGTGPNAIHYPGNILGYGKSYTNSSLGYNMILAISGSAIYIFTDGVNGANNITISLSQAPPVNKWSHMAFVFDGSNWAYYLNGILLKSGTFPIPINTSAPSYLRIGQRCDNDGPYRNAPFNGQIDEVRIWNRALTQAEIRQNMCRRLTGTEPGLVGYWRFDDCGGSIAIDASGNGNNGTLY